MMPQVSLLYGVNCSYKIDFTVTYIGTLFSGRWGEILILLPYGHTEAKLVAANENRRIK